jgi:hypothetical protein
MATILARVLLIRSFDRSIPLLVCSEVIDEVGLVYVISLLWLLLQLETDQLTVVETEQDR